MKSSRMIFGVILAGCLMFAAPGCVVMDPDEAEHMEAEWTEELLDDAVDDAVEDLEQGEGAGDQEFEALDDPPDDFPDPFDPGKTGGGGSGG